MALYLAIIGACFIMTLRSFLVAIGAYKDPILASFEHYGEERIFSPVFSLILWSSLGFYLLSFIFFDRGLMLFFGMLILLIVFSFRDTLHKLLHQQHQFFRSLPAWYAHLVKRTNREERRRIAYLWLRLPPRTRLLYNARSNSFEHWVDQVLLTIA